MRASDIRAGGFYLGKGGNFAREVYDESPSGEVLWRDYDYDNGEPVSSGGCSKNHLAQWAERELTPDERLKMQTAKANEVQKARNAELARRFCRHSATSNCLPNCVAAGSTCRKRSNPGARPGNGDDSDGLAGSAALGLPLRKESQPSCHVRRNPLTPDSTRSGFHGKARTRSSSSLTARSPRPISGLSPQIDHDRRGDTAPLQPGYSRPVRNRDELGEYVAVEVPAGSP